MLGPTGPTAPGPTTGAVPGGTAPPLPTRGRHRHRHVPGQAAEPGAGATEFTASESAAPETGACEPTAPEVTPSGPEHRTETSTPSRPAPRGAGGPEFLAAAQNATVPPARSAPSLRPRTGPVRGTDDRPGLPRRRAQEHLAPQLRNSPARHEPSSRTEADSTGMSFTGHDPGLMAAFQRGFAKAEPQPQDRPREGLETQDQSRAQPPVRPEADQEPETPAPADRSAPDAPPAPPRPGHPATEHPQPHPHDPRPRPHPQPPPRPHPAPQEHPAPQTHRQSHPQTHPDPDPRPDPHPHHEEPTHHGE